MNKIEIILDYLDDVIPNPVCELNYNKDYELLIAVMLSAQTTDKRVNKVTKVLFGAYPSLKALKEADIDDIENIVMELGNYRKKAYGVKEIARILYDVYNGVVPNDRTILESLPMVGRKTTNVVLNELFDVPSIAVDTHVERVSKRLGLALNKDDVLIIERKLMRKIPKDKWGRTHKQLVLFGRYHCLAKSPNCGDCKLQSICKFYKLNK